MRITYQSPDALVIRDTAAVIRAVGGVFVLVGVIAAAVRAREHAGGGTVPLVIGAVCIVIGALMVLLPRTATFAFDKSQRAFIVTRRGLLRRPVREEYSLREIAGVELEEKTDSDGGTMYRVVTVMADGARLPWTGYYSSGRAGKGTAVNAVRAFLDLPAPAGLAAPLAGRATARQRQASGCLLAMMALMCPLFLGIGARTAWVQHHRLATYQPVRVTVLSSGVTGESDGDGGTTYRPDVTYRYEIAGRAYTSSRVTPIKESRGWRWAQRLAGRFAAGGTYTGYYDPAKPSESFLVRESSFIPYVFIAIPLLALVLLGAAGLQRSGATGER